MCGSIFIKKKKEKMGKIQNLAIVGSAGLFLTGLYGTYRAHLVKSFEGEYQEILKNKKEFFYIHEKLANRLDEVLDKSEQQHQIKKYRRSILSYCKGKVLETGVGTSRNLSLYPLGVEVHGIDYSPNMIEKGQGKVTECNIVYHQQDVEKLDFPNDSFDTVVDTFGLEYYINPRQALLEMKRVCKKDGLILLLNVGEGHSEWYNWYKRMNLPYSVCHLGYNNIRPWDRILKDMKFDILTQERFLSGTLYYNVIKND